MLLAEVNKHEADIICMQEVDHFDELLSALKPEGFSGEFYKKRGGKNIIDGSAIFWKDGKFNLVCHSGVDLGVSIMTALMVRLATTDGRPLVVCSTHLKAGFSTQFEGTRSKQVAELVRQLDDFAGGDPIVLGADLNAHFAPYMRCTSETCLDPQELVEPEVVPSLESAGFSSAYGSYPSFTTWSGWLDRDVKATLDYIMIRGKVSAKSALTLPPDSAIGEHPERLPNDFCPSDHLCLVADVVLNAEPGSSTKQIQPTEGKGSKKNSGKGHGKGKGGKSNAWSQTWDHGWGGVSDNWNTGSQWFGDAWRQGGQRAWNGRHAGNW